MRLSSLPSSIISLLLLAPLQQASAGLLPELREAASNVELTLRSLFEKRCDNPCGYYGQVCCAADQVCYTDANNQAQCGAGANQVVTTTAYAPVAATVAAGGGYYSYYTSTYTQTDFKTVTVTYSSLVPGTTPTAAGRCTSSLGQSQCGNQCCLSGQYCSNGACLAVPGSSGYYSSQLYTITTTLTNTATAPLRPTTQTILTLTSTGVVPFQTPTPASTTGAILTGQAASNGGLSGGAIAGIVIGVLLGIFILILFCLCCCAKGLIDGFLSIFGLGPRRRRRTEEVEVIEERRHHSGRYGVGNAAAAGGAAGFASRWFGQRPRRDDTYMDEKRKNDSGLKTLLGAGAGLGALWGLLNLKRRYDRKDEVSEYSYYDSDYYTSSSVSSGRRSRRTDRSRSRSRA